MPLLGSPETRQHFVDLLTKGAFKAYFDQWEVEGNEYSDIFNLHDSDQKTERHIVVAGVGMWQEKAEGDGYYQDNGQEAWQVQLTAKTVAMQVSATQEMIEDNLYMGVQERVKDMATSGAYTDNLDAFTIFNNATSSTIYTAGGTNYTLLSTAHYRVDGGTWANRPASPLDLGVEALETGIASWIENMVDQRGRKVTALPMTLMVGPSDWSVAHRLCESIDRPFSNNNDPNVVRTKYNLKPKIARHMTNDGRWFLLAPKEKTGLVIHTRIKQKIKRDTDTDTGNLLFQGRYRKSYGVFTPLGVWGSP
jgi:hypothetical protein